jgi:hypothetical protein
MGRHFSPAAPPAYPTQGRAHHSAYHSSVQRARIVCLVLLVCFVVLVQTACTPPEKSLSPSETSTVTSQPLPTNIDLQSIVILSANEGWAVGNTTPPPDYPNSNQPMPTPDGHYVDPVIVHFLQGRWSLVPFPADPELSQMSGISLHSVSFVSASAGWAVGNTVLPPDADGFTVGVVLHYTHGQWTVAQESRAWTLSSVFMRSASDGWMVGMSRTALGVLVVHYNGSPWEQVSDPLLSTNIVPGSLTEDAAGTVWFVGTDFTNHVGPDGDAPEVIVSYDGQQWSREPISLGNARLQSVRMVAPGEGWAVGGAPGGTGPHPAGPSYGLILHYHQGVWTDQSHIPAPAGNPYFLLSDIAIVSANEGWIVGPGGMILHGVQGAWRQVPSPTSHLLLSIAMVSTADGWAVGEQGAILHFTQGSWSLYQR